MKSVTVFAFERLCDLTFIPCSGSLWEGASRLSFLPVSALCLVMTRERLVASPDSQTNKSSSRRT